MRTALICVLVLSAAAAGSAFYTDEVVQAAIRDAQDAMAAGEFQLESAKVSRVDMMMEDDNSCCWNCTKTSAKWVMDHVIDHIKKKCAETECPKFKRMCEKAGEHPAVTYGFLLAAVRPMSLGYAWCNGKGACGKKAEEDIMNFDDELSMGQTVDALTAESDKADGALELAAPAEEDFLVEEEDEDVDMRIACRKCIRGVTKGVMWKTIGKIKKFCRKTESPAFKKMCAAAAKHPHVAFGYLFYKIRPMEFAAGYCVGKGKCGPKGCDKFHEEVLFDLMEDDRLSLSDDSAKDAAIFY